MCHLRHCTQRAVSFTCMFQRQPQRSHNECHLVTTRQSVRRSGRPNSAPGLVYKWIHVDETRRAANAQLGDKVLHAPLRSAIKQLQW